MSASSSRGAREKARLQQEQAARRARERRILGIVALALVLVVVGGIVGVQFWRTGRTPTAAPSTATTLAPQTITTGKPIVLGSAGAAHRIRLYEDFHCAHCAEFEEEFGPVITEAQTAGRLAVEIYPMSFIDAGSASAANAMACAAESGFATTYYLGLFANSSLDWEDDQLIALADQVSTTVPAEFSTCVRTKAHQPWVDSINVAAEQAGVTQTPTMFLDDAPVDIASLTPETLKTMINQAPAK
jgi:protein-disulfide isomerase